MKVLASDFDNTIYFSNDSKLTETNIKAVEKFMREGNIFCIVTGRTYMTIKEKLSELKLPYTYLICGDGAMIFDSTDYCINRINIEKSIVEKSVEYLKEQGYDSYLEDGYNITENLNDCIKVVAKYTDKEHAIEVVKSINENINVYAYASRSHININNKICNKKDALERLSEIEKIPRENIYVIGDDINDYEMLEGFKGAMISKHNPILDGINIQKYDSLHEYIENLLEK